MTASISCLMRHWGIYRCDIRVDNPDGRYYFTYKSVPEEEATEENIELWKQAAIIEATSYWDSL
jgi:hypothetical protein